MTSSHVFVSYDHRDQRSAETVAIVLSLVGLHPWLDQWEIVPGSSGATATAHARESADVVLALVGRGSAQRIETDVRAAGAPEAGRPEIVPVLLPGAPGIPDVLAGRAVVDLRETPVDSVAATAALLRSGLDVLPGRPREGAEAGAEPPPDEMHHDLERVRRILGPGHPDVVRAEAVLADRTRGERSDSAARRGAMGYVFWIVLGFILSTVDAWLSALSLLGLVHPDNVFGYVVTVAAGLGTTTYTVLFPVLRNPRMPLFSWLIWTILVLLDVGTSVLAAIWYGVLGMSLTSRIDISELRQALPGWPETVLVFAAAAFAAYSCYRLGKAWRALREGV